MLWVILTISWTAFIWDFYLNYRQYRIQKNTIARPHAAKDIISEEDYAKARSYAVDKHDFNLIYSMYSQVGETVILVSELIFFFWRISGNLTAKIGLTNEVSYGFDSSHLFLLFGFSFIVQSVIFVTLVGLVETVLHLPWEYYLTFVIEEKHGFNKQTVSFFFKDKIKKLLVGLVIMAPVLAAVIYIVQHGGPYFFVYAWIFLSVVIFLFLTIYPEFIAPLFDKYVPLPESELRKKIFALAKSVNFPLTKLWVVQGSARSAHSNAYMYGFWKNKRIVLYDTLLNEKNNELLKESIGSAGDTGEEKKTEANDKRKDLGMSDDEVVAVLGHELGHWALYHSICNLVIAEANMLLMLLAFSWFYKAKSLYQAFGFYDSTPTVVGLIIVCQFVMTPYSELISFLVTVLTRKMEFAADKYSAKLGYADQLCDALIKLGKDNLLLPVDDHLYSMFNHSHPPILERIAAMKKSQ
ncbi:unnamed protein product [Enterobius vermicularis]|uniref:CAAX prenyl protease n=1 Tax=Enterobius vermicularis TaxID=51028 RepID=A0A0N4VHP3_ENTVE|nr:unnamed protein product [Enterobius vermicularis]